MKMPGTYAVYAAAMALAGPSAAGIRFALLAANLATIGLVFLVGRRLGGDAEGALAAAAYGVTSFGVSVMGFAAHATHFVVLFAVAGLYVLLRAMESSSLPGLLASGALFGAALVMKQHGAAFALAGALWLALRTEHGRFAKLAAFGAGVAAPVVLVLVLLAAAGVFNRFWFWNVVYASAYARGSTWTEGIDNLAYQLRLMRPLAGFALLAAAGVWVTRERGRFLVVLLAGSVVAVLPGLYFRNHYFIQVLPAISLLAAMALSGLARRFGPAAAALAFLVAAGYAVSSEATLLFKASPLTFCRAVYGSNPFPEAIEVGNYLRAHARPGDAVAVLGSEPEIYFYADRPAATGYIYMYGLMEEQPYAAKMQREMIAEVEFARPAFIVVVNASLSWLLREGSSNTVFAWAEGYLAGDYDQVGLVEVTDGPPAPLWDAAANGSVPSAENYLLVYRRKPGV
jgi:hypothetical protein